MMKKPLKKSGNVRSDASDSDLGTRRFGYVVIVALLLGIGGWSAFAPLEIAAPEEPAQDLSTILAHRVLLARPLGEVIPFVEDS